MRKLIVHYIQRAPKNKDSKQILKIGGVNNTGQRWAISTQEAVDAIRSGQWELFILCDKNEIPVLIREEENQKPHLTAHGNDFLYNLLENLPEINLEIMN